MVPGKSVIEEEDNFLAVTLLLVVDLINGHFSGCYVGKVLALLLSSIAILVKLYCVLFWSLAVL